MTNTCRKVPYKTKSDAQKDAKQILFSNRMHKKIGNKKESIKKLIAYECKHCNKWHLSSQRQHKGKQKRIARNS